MSTTMTGLPQELIDELMGSQRTKGQYGKLLHKFMNDSDEAGINPKDVWPVECGKKDPGTLYQGFRNAATKAGVDDKLVIRRVDENVFILHKERIAVVQAALEEAADNDDSENDSE